MLFGLTRFKCNYNKLIYNKKSSKKNWFLLIIISICFLIIFQFLSYFKENRINELTLKCLFWIHLVYHYVNTFFNVIKTKKSKAYNAYVLTNLDIAKAW
jgi:nitric oxide reductase large subunit